MFNGQVIEINAKENDRVELVDGLKEINQQSIHPEKIVIRCK